MNGILTLSILLAIVAKIHGATVTFCISSSGQKVVPNKKWVETVNGKEAQCFCTLVSPGQVEGGCHSQNGGASIQVISEYYDENVEINKRLNKRVDTRSTKHDEYLMKAARKHLEEIMAKAHYISKGAADIIDTSPQKNTKFNLSEEAVNYEKNNENPVKIFNPYKNSDYFNHRVSLLQESNKKMFNRDQENKMYNAPVPLSVNSAQGFGATEKSCRVDNQSYNVGETWVENDGTWTRECKCVLTANGQRARTTCAGSTYRGKRFFQ